MSEHTSKTRTAPPRPPDGWPFQHGRYRSYVLFALTGVFMAIGCIHLLMGVAALGAGEQAWRDYLASMGSPLMLGLNLIVIGFTVFFAIRWGWVGRKIAAGRVGPIPGPPLPLPVLGAAPVGGFVAVWLVLILILGGAIL